MKIILPVSNADKELLPQLTDLLCHYGNLHDFSITLYPTESVVSHAYQAAAKLSVVSPSVKVHALPEFDGGWPKAPNAHWAHVAQHVALSGETEPWLWLECDTVPTAPDWALQLRREYNGCGKPLLGMVRQTPFRDENGDVLFMDDDMMMLGIAVYPAWLVSVTELKPLFNNLLRPVEQAPEQPFDVYLRWVLRRIGWAHTELMLHNWRSTDYKRSEGGYTFLNNENEPSETKAAVLMHGCKDGSLFKLLMQKEKLVAELSCQQEELEQPRKEETQSPAPEKPKQQPVVIAPDAPRSRFILGPVTPDEEAAWPCDKAAFEAWLGEQQKGVRLRAAMEKFGFESLDKTRRAIQYWGYEAPVPSTFIRKKA